jgi:hypothetical protein
MHNDDTAPEADDLLDIDPGACATFRPMTVAIAPLIPGDDTRWCQCGYPESAHDVEGEE